MKYKEIIIILTLYVTLNVSYGQETNSPSARELLNVYVASPYAAPRPALATPGQRPIGSGEPVVVGQAFFSGLNLSAISSLCPRDALYSSFHPSHATAVSLLTSYFERQRTGRGFFEFASQIKKDSNIHPKVWYSAFNAARSTIPLPALDGVNTVSPIELFSSSFFPAEVIPANGNPPIKCLDETMGEDNGIENLLWYFREDVQMNGHHWVWHLLYPSNVTRAIDRRGEFFYFFHHDLMARYTAERLSNGLPPQKPLNIAYDTILEEGYNSHLHEAIANKTYPPRRPYRPLKDSLTRAEQLVMREVIIYKDRVIDAINQGGILHEKSFVELNAFDRINTFGDIAEAATTSINSNIYGIFGYHNLGHLIISCVDGPLGNASIDFPSKDYSTENITREGIGGVMGGLDTTMRDMLFYRWHQTVDLIFQAYKLTHLKPYTPHGGDYPLVFEGVKISSVQILPENIQGRVGLPLNNLETFWRIRNFVLDGGIDFRDNRTRNICAKHLDHQEFTYHINIENSLPANTLATVRIFMAPRFKSIEQRRRYTMEEQRPLFFTMDSFKTILPPGNSVVIRTSRDSTLTTDWPKSYREIEFEIENGIKLRSVCDCGYPHHLLLPKGTPSGMVFDLFVMVTDGVKDQVVNKESSAPPVYECPAPSHIHCGLRNSKYPDSKPMGYPFDRKIYNVPTLVGFTATNEHKVVNRVVENLEEYVRNIPNMHASQVAIHHRNEIRENPVVENYGYLK